MFALPTLKDLMVRARTEFRTNLKGSDAWTWPNNVYASAKVMAGLTFEVFGFLSYVSRQKFAVTAPDIDSLALHGAEFGIPQKPAAPAIGDITITATAAITVDTGAIFRRVDGVQYFAAAGGGTLNAGSLTVPVQAAVDGKNSNAISGTPMEMVSGFTTNGTAVAAAAGDITLGVDVEDIESYRARILFRKRNPPHGGSAADYVIWASQVAGVSRVFVERRWNGRGTVRVFFLMDDLYADGIPQVADVARVRSHIEGLMPAGVELSVSAPVAHPINVTISGLLPATTPVQEAIRAELRDTFLRRSRVAGEDTPHDGMPFLASPTTFSRSWVAQAVANATGEDRHILILPAAETPLLRTEIATLGAVLFV